MSIITLLLATVVQSSQGCGDPDVQGWKFAGCGWSPSECYYSCRTLGAYKAELDSELCPQIEAEWACYCPDEN